MSTDGNCPQKLIRCSVSELANFQVYINKTFRHLFFFVKYTQVHIARVVQPSDQFILPFPKQLREKAMSTRHKRFV